MRRGIDADQSWRRSTWFGRRRATSSSVMPAQPSGSRAVQGAAWRQVPTSGAIFRARHGRLTYVHELAFRGHTCSSRGGIEGPRISAQLLQLDRPEGFINPLSAGCNKVISSRSSLTHLPCQIALLILQSCKDHRLRFYSTSRVDDHLEVRHAHRMRESP